MSRRPPKDKARRLLTLRIVRGELPALTPKRHQRNLSMTRQSPWKTKPQKQMREQPNSQEVSLLGEPQRTKKRLLFLVISPSFLRETDTLGPSWLPTTCEA
jgi:hypothetical protein